MSTSDPFLYTSGPRDSKVLIVGEAWGAEEQREQRPFCGFSGKELDRILFDAGLNRQACLCTNVVDAHPQGNDFTQFLERGSRNAELFRGVNATPTLRAGHAKLQNLINAVRPKLIIGCGNWPLWALTSHAKLSTQKGYRLPSGIMNWRGSQTWTERISDGHNATRYPYLPIIHPAAILRSWDLRHITCQDLRARAARFLNGKCSWEAKDPVYLADGRFDPLVEQLNTWLDRAASGPFTICCDVETWKRRELCVVGLSDGKTSICIPFFYFDEMGTLVDCFTLEQETMLSTLIRRLLQHPSTRITNQNYSYDWQYLFRFLGIEKVPAFDTMLAHHLLWPGTPKDLAYLASLYCDHYCYWKDESQDWDAKSTHLDMWLYNCKDTAYTYEITQVLQSLIQSTPGMDERFKFQMEQWEVANAMGRSGIRWDTNRASSFSADLERVGEALQQWLDRAMPEDLRRSPSGKPWYSSAKHQQYIFYDRLGIAPVLHKKTKKPTLDKESFEQLKKRAPYTGPIFDKLKQLRSIEVFRNNFLSSLLGPDDRMHPSYNVGGTETYRWSSSSNAFGEGMNMQNMPKMEEE